jgi:hypothetical protein
MMKVFLYPEYKDYVLSGNPVDFYRKFNLDLEVEQTNCFRQECSESISHTRLQSIERKIINDIDIPLKYLIKENVLKEDYRIKKEEYIASLTTITNYKYKQYNHGR